MRYGKVILSVCLMLQVSGIKGQNQKIDPTLEVTRNFDASMLNIHKSLLSTQINDSLARFNLDFNYTIFDKPYRDLYEFSPIPSVQIYSPLNVKHPVFLLKAGIHHPLAPEAELYIAPRLKNGNILSISFGYTGIYKEENAVKINDYGKMEADKNYDIPAHSTSLQGKIDYRKYWKRGIFSLSGILNYGRDFYYGYNSSYFTGIENDYSQIGHSSYMRDNNSHRYNTAGVTMGVRSTGSKSSGIKFNYNLDATYRHTSDKLFRENLNTNLSAPQNRLKEDFIKVEGEFGPNFGRYNKFTIGFNSENVIYSGLQEYKYGIYEIIPQYTFESGRFTFKGGVKLSGRYKGKSGADRFHNNIFAKADALFEAVRRKLWLYGLIDGGNSINSYSSLLEQNRWIAPDMDLKATSVPFMAQAGIKGLAGSRFNYNLYVRFSAIEGLLQYVYMGRNMLDAEYSNTKCFTAGFDMGYINNRLDIAGGLSYNSYTDVKKSLINKGKPFGMPPVQFYLKGEYNWRERIFAGLSLRYRDEIYVYDLFYSITQGSDSEIKAPGFVDLGVTLKYRLNRNFTLFAEGKNLLGKEMILYPDYMDSGVSFGGGVLVKF